jgi:hypothetical protein
MQNRELAGRQRVFSALVSLLTLLDLEFGKANANSRRVRLLVWVANIAKMIQAMGTLQIKVGPHRRRKRKNSRAKD